MPSYQAHLYQAQHNESLLAELKASLCYKDWLVTVAFYTAIHYVEAYFFKDPAIIHTENTIPTYPDGTRRHSPHIWRMKILQQKNKKVWRGFRSLYNESNVARYLLRPGADTVTTDAQTHWTDDEARDFVDIDLHNIKHAFRFT